MVFSYFNSSDIFTNSAKAFIKSGQPNMVLVLSLVFIYLTQFSTIYKRLAPQSRLYLCTVNTYELHILLLKPRILRFFSPESSAIAGDYGDGFVKGLWRRSRGIAARRKGRLTHRQVWMVMSGRWL